MQEQSTVCKPSGSSCMIDTDGLQGYHPNSNSSSINTNTQSPCHLSAIVTSPAVSQKPSLTFRQDLESQTSTDKYPLIGEQSASDIALPSLVVASSASAFLGPSAGPQSSSLIGNLSAPVLGIHSQESSWLPSRRISVLSSRLPSSTSQSLPFATSTKSQSSFDLEYLLGAFNQFPSSTEHSYTSLHIPTTTMTSPQASEPPENALDVLLSALPSDVASSLEAGYSIVTHQLLATSQTETTRPAPRPSPSDQTERSELPTSRQQTRTGERPTTGHTARPTSQSSQRPVSKSTSRPSIDHPPRPTSHHSPRPSTHTTSSSSETPTTHSPTTLSTIPSTTTSPPSSTTPPNQTADLTNAAESSEPSITAARQQSNGTIAGIATGTVAGIVLITVAIFFLLRRRQRKRALAAAAGPQQAYPEVAWLYDPVRSPPRSLSPSPQLGGASPQLGMTQVQARRSSLLAPEVVVMEGEPLLPPPGRVATRENSPARGAGGRDASPAGR